MSITCLHRLSPILFLCLSVISGCVDNTKENTLSSENIQLEQQAQTYMNAGDYIAAAEIYQDLSANSPESRSGKYTLLAAEAYFAGNDIEQAESLLDGYKDNETTSILNDQVKVLYAKIYLQKNDYNRAIGKLDFILPTDAPSEFQIAYYLTRADAYSQSGQIVAALKDRDRLFALLDTTDSISVNNEAIWTLLNSMSLEILTRESFAEQSNTDLIGWYDLAIISRTKIFDSTILETAIHNWRETYPGHPANLAITEKIFNLADEKNRLPEQIALLLPNNESYREVSAAIRQGFLAAWYESPGQKPVIKIYDSSRSEIQTVYQNALNDGADFIVGPLEKEKVADLISTTLIEMTTLALNQVQTGDEDDKSNTAISGKLFQFGLLPEHEAKQVAERAWADGHANALVITPDNEWGRRLNEAFSQHWQKLGGHITDNVQIGDNLENYALPIKQILNIDKSEERSKRLVATLNRNIVSEPRFRRDADMIFIAVAPKLGRQLVPQLRFYRADEIPTYSISSIYNGVFDPQVNADIDNIIFADMPWILSPEFEYSPIQQTLNNAWNQETSPYRRLYAFGIDAYQIIAELNKLRATKTTYQGKTGQLSITDNNIIQRKSVWARFVRGTPRPIDTKPAL